MTEYYLREDLARHWDRDDPFKHAMELDGELFRDMPSRRTLRFFCNKQPYFAKIHTGVGWREIIKNLLQGRMPILDASPEWHAIKRLEEIGVETMTIAGYGVRRWNPAQRESFLITESLQNTESLEDFCREWQTSPPTFPLKNHMITKVASISRQLHQNGINHRDYYICHFLLDLQQGKESLEKDKIKLFLIDLHRSQIRKKVPIRWLIKDIGSLYFSAMDIGLTQRDIFRFIEIYSGQPWRQSLIQDRRFWEKVTARAITLYEKMHHRKPKLLF
ncbi:MAG: lipopolysaccharide core heptose(I) kinase RfaP [Pseudomonadales bacterium]|jgi:heptose I phosphotransferase|nr:lipopolysaccharide core heptose(I) kinase RfaP [Pseudomonadales bacterium]MCP5213479.1 lipopolysaccharide core heptose(I) kinase RfaP [Pseudomonadales bacterium]